MNFARIYLGLCSFPHPSHMELGSPFNLQISFSPQLKKIFLYYLFSFSPSFWNIYGLHLCIIFLQDIPCTPSSKPLCGLQQGPSLLTIHLIKFLVQKLGLKAPGCHFGVSLVFLYVCLFQFLFYVVSQYVGFKKQSN